MKMTRLTAGPGAMLAVLAIAVPTGTAGDGQQGDGKTRPVVICAQTALVARIAVVRTDAVVVRPGQSETGRPLVVRLNDDTVVRSDDATVDETALKAGLRARLLVHGCRSGDVKTLTAKVIVLLKDAPPAAGNTAPPTTTEPKPETKPSPLPEVCGKGEFDTVLVSVGTNSVTVRTESSEGVKVWPVSVNGDTVVRKGDQSVALSSLHAGDRVHMVILRCPGSGTVTALRIAVFQSA